MDMLTCWLAALGPVILSRSCWKTLKIASTGVVDDPFVLSLDCLPRKSASLNVPFFQTKFLSSVIIICV